MARIFCGFCSSNGDFGLMIGRSSRSSLLPISASTLIKQQKLYGSEKNTFTCKAIYLPQSSESGFKPHSIRFSEPVYSTAFIWLAIWPLITAGSSIVTLDNFSTSFRQSLWGIEAVTLLIAGSCYSRWHQIFSQKAMQPLLVSISCIYALTLWSASPPLIVLGGGLYALATHLLLMNWRDSCLISAGNDPVAVTTASAGVFAFHQLSMAISPFLVTEILSVWKLDMLIIAMMISASLGSLYFLTFFATGKRASEI